MAGPLDWLQQMLSGQPPPLSIDQAPSDTGPQVLQYLQDVMSGKIAANALPNTYDPNRSFAANVRDPQGLQQAMDVAMGVSGPGLATRAAVKGAAVEPKFPQYAERYPEVGPPTPTIDKTTGNVFDQKTLTPEAQAFQRERTRIQRDMDKSGYEPYFDPAERFYADLSQYPPANVDTLTLIPKKQATIDKYMEAIGAPETAKALRSAYANGVELGNADHWYAMGQLEKKYIDQHGPEAGRNKFLDEFAVPMAATTSGNDPTFNLMMSHYMEYLRNRGEPIPASNQLPYPVGGRYAGTNLTDYASIREAGGYPGLGADQPKMHNFARSYIGDLSRAVIDEQMATGMLAHAPGLVNQARKSAFGLLEAPVHAEAAALGVQPGNVQDVAWAGFKNQPGKPMISIVNDAIERTHRLTGMPRDEIVRRGLVGKEIPLYGLLGAAGAGGLVGQE